MFACMCLFEATVRRESCGVGGVVFHAEGHWVVMASSRLACLLQLLVLMLQHCGFTAGIQTVCCCSLFLH